MESSRARRVIEQSIGGTDLEPAGFGPNELVLVRRVTLRVRGAEGAADGCELGQSLRSRVAELARGAVRPERGILPARAVAVRFSSLAEALATFALSSAEGRAGGEWWWRSLFGPVSGDWSELWCRHAAEHPVALEHLAASGRLPGVARRMDSAAGERLLEAVVRAFGLTRLAEASRTGRTRQASVAATRGSRPNATGYGDEGAARVAEAARELSRYTALAADDSVPAAVRAWIAVASAVARAPRVARGPRFAAVVAELVGHSAHAAVPTTKGVASARFPASAGEDAAVGEETPRPGTPVGEEQVRSLSAPALASAGSEAPPPLPQVRPSCPLAPDASEPPAQPQALALEAPEEVVRTAFGGALYLVNVAIALGLYADFTEPLKPGLDLPLWDFVAAAARSLSDDARALEADPLWAWLARTAGRHADEPPGTGAVAPPDWLTPESWRAWMEPAVVEPTPVSSWLEWFDRALPGVERRLSRALGGPPGRFLRQTGALVHAGASVHVHFALALHPVEIRLSGLDRDPGFVPAAGVDMRFVYE
jgi:hypothetical protein